MAKNDTFDCQICILFTESNYVAFSPPLPRQTTMSTVLERLPRSAEIKLGSALGALFTCVSNTVVDIVKAVDAQIEQAYQACDPRPDISKIYTEDLGDLVIVSNDAIDSEYEFVTKDN